MNKKGNGDSEQDRSELGDTIRINGSMEGYTAM